MLTSNLLRKNSIKSLALGLFTLVAGSAAYADTVLDNLSLNGPNSATVGTTIGAAFTTGTTALVFSDVIFPQLRFNTNGSSYDSYVAGETFSINLRNADGTVGLPVFTSFTSDHDFTGSGQTEADASSAFTLLPNTGYYFSVTAPTMTGWSYTTATTYNTADGVTAPATDTDYKTLNGTTSYFNMTQGPQLILIDAVPVASGNVPEPSTVSMLALAVGGTLLVVRRSRGAKNA